jgi:hypothetical protein
MVFSLDTFTFKDNFKGLTDLQFDSARQIVEATFSGVFSLWEILPEKERNAKIRITMHYLIGWQLLQLYPEKGIGVASNGGMPLAGKSISTIHLKFAENTRQSAGLSVLENNAFGLMALNLIQNSPEAFTLYR